MDRTFLSKEETPLYNRNYFVFEFPLEYRCLLSFVHLFKSVRTGSLICSFCSFPISLGESNSAIPTEPSTEGSYGLGRTFDFGPPPLLVPRPSLWKKIVEWFRSLFSREEIRLDVPPSATQYNQALFSQRMNTLSLGIGTRE